MKPNVTKENHRYQRWLIQSSEQRVLEIIFRWPEKEMSLSDLAKEAGVAKSHIGLILGELKKAEMVTITKLSKIWRIKANQQNVNFLKSKIVYNLNFIYQSRLVDFLNEHYGNPKAIILFGSFRRGEDLSNSDIDIAIETDEIEEYQVILLRVLENFEHLIGRHIQLHLFNRKTDLHVFNNIANGIVLDGFLEVHP